MSAELLELSRVEFPTERVAGFGDCRGALVKDKTDGDFRIARILVERFPEETEEVVEFGVVRIDQPGDALDGAGSVR